MSMLLLGVGGRGGSPSFSPADIAGLALWLDASDAATLFQDAAGTTPAVADNDPVGRWADKSGNGRHVTQATAGSRGTLKTAVQNGRGVVRFDGTADHLTSSSQLLSGVTGLSVFLVLHGTGESLSDSDRPLGHNTPPANDLVITFPGGKPAMRIAAEEPAAAGPNSRSGTTAGYIVSGVATATSITVWDNGVAGTPRTQALGTFSTSASGFGVGALPGPMSPYPGDVAEVLVYGSALSTTDREAVEAYLMTKWGIS
jgi:hypothetical protein